MLYAKLQRIIGIGKELSAKTVALHGANVRFVLCRAVFWLLFVFVEAFQTVEGVGADDGVAVGDVMLPASGLPFTVLLRVVLTVELSEGDCLGIFLMPAVKFLYTLLILVPFVCSRVTDHDAPHQADADKCADTYDYREIELDQIFQPYEISLKAVAVFIAEVSLNA